MGLFKTYIISFMVIGLTYGVTVTPVAADEKDLVELVNEKARLVERLNKRAERALISAVRDRAFSNYFSAANTAEKTTFKSRIDKLSLNVQSRFDVDEMCLIDENGHEHSRIVGDTIAPDEELSDDESQAVFFNLGFSLKPLETAVSPLYISGDTHRWVVAYVTPVDMKNKKRAILHFEHNLSKYRDLVNRGMSKEQRYLLMMTQDGYIFSDSRRDIPLEAREGKTDFSDYFENIADWGVTGIQHVMNGMKHQTAQVVDLTHENGDRYTMAYQTVRGWTLAVVEKHP